jgi:hypothetical protein
LRTPEGSKPVEEFEPGDRILARDERDPSGPVEVKTVEAVFVRSAPILHLHIGGRVIQTTAEHPFWVYNRGWVKAGALQVGDLLATKDEQWIAVEDLLDTGEFEAVYNLRVADHHTYFVGGWDWEFCVWAHNTECDPSNRLAKAIELAEQEMDELRGVRHVEDVRSVQSSHDAGTQLGRQHAELELRLRDEFGWDNPFDHHGRYGQGFDDILVDRRGKIWIVEYKGGEAVLSPGQMERAWVQRNIDRLIQGRGLRAEIASDPVARRYYREMGEYLQRALDNGQLHGVTISTPRLENGLFGLSRVVQRRSPY